MSEPIQMRWERLDKRMLLIHPITEIGRLAPLLIASLVIGLQSENPLWSLLGLGVVVGFALLRWVTTTYRVSAERIELRSGLFARKLLSIPRSRIRSVDIEANVLHRILGLAVLHVGTGSRAGEGEQFKLNALSAGTVERLRRELLERPDAPEISSGGTEIGHWSPNWVRYAPFSLTGLAIVAPLVAIPFQYGAAQIVDDVVDRLPQVGILAAVLVGLVTVVVVSTIASCVSYLLAYWDLRVLDDGKTLHTASGLLTKRQVTLDLARLRGASINLPLLVRLAGGAALETIMTGTVARKRVLPFGPRAEIERVVAHLLGDAAPYATTLTAHGPIALRRRFTRMLWPAAILVIGVGLLRPPWLAWVGVALALAGMAALAWDRYRGLGHAVLPGWLVTQSGSLARDRDCVQAAGIIGWTVQQSWFQRRAGVATVIAATAAGRGFYRVIDLPVAQAWDLVERVTPGAGDIWTRTAAGAPSLPDRDAAAR